MKTHFNFSKELLQGCQHVGLPEPDKNAVKKLFSYFLELKKWSRKVNLIAKGTGEMEIVEKHFLDSLTLLPALTGTKSHLLDIGTGAGFPGLVCKAAMPELQVTLVEPRQRRVSFLRHIVRTLKLQNITIVECRAEDEAKLPSGSGFTHITSRAVNKIKPFLGMCNRFAAADTKIICMKGPKWKEVLDAFQASDSEKIFKCISTTEYILPESKSIRNVMIFDSK